MGFKITCTCGKHFGVKDQYAGKKGRCPHCGTSLLLQPDGGAPPAPAAPSKGAVPGSAASTGKPHKRPPAAPAGPAKEAAPASKPHKRPAPGEKVSVRPGPGDIEIRSGATPTNISPETGEVDVTSQMAGIRHIMQLFCPTCGTRYNKGAARCSNCHAPLSAEEIAAAAAEKKPPLLPWLPRMHLSTPAKLGISALIVLLVATTFYLLVLRTPLQRKNRLQAELTLVENALAADNTLLWLRLDMPSYPYHKPATVKATGKWEQRASAAIFCVGTGTYDLAKREVVLTANDGGKSYTYHGQVPPALHLAAVAEDARPLQLLLADPACDVNQLDAHGATALHAAAAAPGDLVDRVQLLLEHKADMSLRDEKGMTPMAAGLSASNKKVVKFFRGWAAVDPTHVILLPD